MLRAELDKADNRAVDVDSFLVSLRKYSRAKKLTERMLNELVERIDVFHAERVEGEHRQKVRIHYNCVGTIDIPALPTIFDCKVQMQTRKGVVVTYSSLQEAI